MLHAIYVFKDVIYVICKGVGGWCWRLIFRSSGDPGEPCKDKIGFLILTTWGVDTWKIPGGSPDHWSLLVLLCEAGLLVLLTLCLFCWGGKWELCLKFISYQLNFGSNQMVFGLQQHSESHFFGTPCIAIFLSRLMVLLTVILAGRFANIKYGDVFLSCCLCCTTAVKSSFKIHQIQFSSIALTKSISS